MDMDVKDGMEITDITDIMGSTGTVDILGIMDITEIKDIQYQIRMLDLHQIIMAIHPHHQRCILLLYLIMEIISFTHNKGLMLFSILNFIHPRLHHQDIYNNILCLTIHFYHPHLHLNLNHFKNKCTRCIIREEDVIEKEINTISEVERAVVHLVRVLVPPKNLVRNLEVRNVDGRVNKRTLPLVLNKLKNTKNKFTKIIPKK